MPDETEEPDEPPAVTVELKVNGRAVPGFIYKQFADKRGMDPAKARRLVEFWLELGRE